jgi:hypothetical protein
VNLKVEGGQDTEEGIELGASGFVFDGGDCFLAQAHPIADVSLAELAGFALVAEGDRQLIGGGYHHGIVTLCAVTHNVGFMYRSA